MAGGVTGRLCRSAETLALHGDLVTDRTRTAGSADAETPRVRHAPGVGVGRLGHWDRDALAARAVRRGGEAVRR
ncbi:hypothetical protein [Streptomyces sp.]|uniref:hypothetical protein n=1 Tax=Streptomyces sp. TaxID=1931 RepID=UPI002F418323